MAEEEKDSRLIKFRLSTEEQDTVRLAAALRRLSMAAFARETTIDAARRHVAEAGLKLPSEGSSSRRRKGKT